MVYILVSKDSQEHQTKPSPLATVRKAWACRCQFSLDNSPLPLDLQKQDPEWHRDELCRLHRLTPLRHRNLWDAHDTAVGGNFRRATTYIAVRQCFFWPGMCNGVQEYTEGCDMYMQGNWQAGKVVGLLQPLPVAQGRREGVGVDFIPDMATSVRGIDCLVIIVNQFYIQVHWMPCTKTIGTGESVVLLLLEAIEWPHDVPQQIGSNREMSITSDIYAEVRKLFQTKLLMSLAIHAQTDRLWEISNELFTWYLQAFTHYHRDKWDTMVPIAQYAYNAFTHLSTNCSPFELYLGFTPYIPLDFIMGQRQHAEM